MKLQLLKLRMTTKSLSAVALTLLLGAAQTYATQTVRELWDGLGAGGALYGRGSGSTSVGFATNTWAVNPVGQTGLSYDNGGTLNWPFGNFEYSGFFLSASGGGNGLEGFYGGNMNTLTNPATSLPYGNFSSQSYATRALATNSYIDFQANGTYYFSVRVIKSYPWWHGDNSEGIGFASSDATNANFVGAGFTRQAVSSDTDTNLGVGGVLPGFYAADGVTDLGNSVYISTGTLDQAGISGHPGDSGGAYYPQTTAPITFDPNGVDAYVLVGRLTTTTSGASTLDVKVYYPSDTVDTDPNLITWTATYSFTETNVMTRFLLWGYGQGASQMDGMRVGTTYGDVIGLELFGAPTAVPGSTVYAGTDVTLGANAGLNTGNFPMAFQWRSNSVDILDQTNSTLVLTNPTTAFTADYSVVVSNYYGMYTNVLHVTVNPAVPPFFIAGGKPVATTRYLGAPTAIFTAKVDGTPPFTYQWKHAGTNIGSATITSTANNTLSFGPITLADVGDYSVTVTNQFGSTNSAVPGPAATLTVLNPAAGSYAAVLTSYTNLYGYWRLDDSVTTNNTALYDDWGRNNGNINYSDLTNNPANWTFGAAGVAGVGFNTPHLAIAKGNQFWTAPYRLDLPRLPGYSNTMTFAMWVNTGGNDGCALMARNGYGNAYGLETATVTDVVTNNLRFDWGGGITFDSGLVVPRNTWTFVALVVEPGQATVYMGTNKTSLVSATSGPLFVFSSGENGDAATSLSPLVVGRNPWPWAEDGNGSQWASWVGTYSDVSVIYESLTPAQIQGLYEAGLGLWIDATPDGGGNLILNWLPGHTLQEANNVQGPYTDIGAATPPYSVPLTPTTATKFYRIKQ